MIMNFDKVKRSVLNTVIGIIVAGMFSLIPFYYYTKNTLAQHSEKIDKLNVKVENLNDTIRDNEQAPIVIQGEIKAMKKDINHIQKSQEKHEKKLDKIYDLLIKIDNNN